MIRYNEIFRKDILFMNKSTPRTKKQQTDAAADIPAEAIAGGEKTSLVKSLWLGSCSRFTVLCLIMLVVSAIASDSLTVTYVDTVHFFLLLPFGFCLAIAARVRLSDSLSTGVKCMLHATVTLGGFYLFAYLPYQIRTSPSPMQVLILLLAAMLLYAVVMGVYALVAHRRRRKAVEEAPYVSQYRKP